MARIAGVNIPTQKRVVIALQYIHGIGQKFATEICEKVKTYIDLGCTGFIPWCSDYPDTESMDLFAREVMPNFR